MVHSHRIAHLDVRSGPLPFLQRLGFVVGDQSLQEGRRRRRCFVEERRLFDAGDDVDLLAAILGAYEFDALLGTLLTARESIQFGALAGGSTSAVVDGFLQSQGPLSGDEDALGRPLLKCAPSGQRGAGRDEQHDCAVQPSECRRQHQSSAKPRKEIGEPAPLLLGNPRDSGNHHHGVGVEPSLEHLLDRRRGVVDEIRVGPAHAGAPVFDVHPVGGGRVLGGDGGLVPEHDLIDGQDQGFAVTECEERLVDDVVEQQILWDGFPVAVPHSPSCPSTESLPGSAFGILPPLRASASPGLGR